MKPLYTQEQFDNAKCHDRLPCECYECKEVFYVDRHKIQESLKPNSYRSCKFCSLTCNGLNKKQQKNQKCGNCNNKISKNPARIKYSKSGKIFCSQSCAAFYNNAHKTHGYRRSKLEIYLEQELIKLYPKQKILFNDTKTIGCELDIYFPNLNLAFELNGIFHYEPIYGEKTLNNIKNRDNNKFHICLKNKIGLCIIDTTSQKYFKEHTSQKFLNIIVSILNENIN